MKRMYKYLKKLLFLGALYSIVPCSLFAQTPQSNFDALFKKADELYYAYDYDQAIKYFYQTLEIAQTEGLPFVNIYKSLYSITLCYQYSYNSDLAIDNIERTLDSYSDSMNTHQLGQQYYLLGSVNYEIGELEDAFAAYNQSIKYHKASGRADKLALAYISRSFIYIALDNYKAALNDLNDAENVVAQDDDRTRSSLYMAYSSLYDYMGNPTKGLPFLEKAYQLAKVSGQKRVQLNTSILLANAMIFQNQFREGLQYANDGLYLANESNNLNQLAIIYDVIGRIYLNLAEFELSVLHFNEAIAVFQQIGSNSNAAILEITIAKIALQQGDFKTAELILTEIDKSVLNKRLQIQLLLKKAEVQIAKQAFVNAEKYLSEAMPLSIGDLEIMKPQIYNLYLKFPDILISATKKLEYARLLLKSTNTKGTFEVMSAEKKMAEIIEPINSDSAFYYAYKTLSKLEERRLSTHSSSFKNSLNANWQHFYYTVASWEVQHNKDFSTAFNLFERAKSRALFDQIYERQIFSVFDIQNPASMKLLELQKKIDRFYLQESETTIEAGNERGLSIAELELEYQALQDNIINTHPEMKHIEYPEVSMVEEAQAMLEKNSAIINYGISNNQLFIYLIRKNDLRFIPLQSSSSLRTELAHNIETFRTAIISQADITELKAVSSKLTALLFDPISNYLEGVEHLIIVPDGPLHLLPFDALLLGNKYLIEQFSVKYIPSVSVLNVINEQLPKDFEKSMLGIASSGFETGDDLAVGSTQNSFSTLPYTIVEIESIQSNFPASTIIKNEEVTEAAFKNLSLADYRYLHFATHGNINESVPEQSGLILSKKSETETLFGEDGYLNAREISQLNLNANLVVLSACNTGVGRIINGEGVMGLQRSFLVAGASSVMVSLWSIYDRSTPVFMDLFYENLIEVENEETSFIDKALMYANMYSSKLVDFKMLALQKTKQQMIEHPYYNHPVHWAPFVLNGK